MEAERTVQLPMDLADRPLRRRRDHPIAEFKNPRAQIPRWIGLAFGAAGAFRGKGFFSQTGRGLFFRVPLAEPGGTLGLPFGSFAFRWQSQAERSACLSGPSPLQGLGPRSLTPPLAHSSPGSGPGSNAPNPLAGDGAIHGICKICKNLHRLFGFHRGIGAGRLHSAYRLSILCWRWGSLEGLEAFEPGLDPGKECAKGELRPLEPLKRGGTRRATRPLRPVPPAGRGREAPADQEIEPFPLVSPAPPKEGPFDLGIW